MIAEGTPESFIFPRACERVIDSTRVCRDPSGWSFGDSLRGQGLSVGPVAGYEYRGRRDYAHALDFGMLSTGKTGALAFHLDARMFVEMQEKFHHASYDREIVDRQDEEASGTVAYSSYSRYRSNLTLDLPWGRFTAGRDAAHWGPGLFGNLVFHQDAVPFNQVTWLLDLGPVSVITLYGRLAIRGDSLGGLDYGRDTRSIFAHRYEWRAARNLVLGMSEQLVTYDSEEPFGLLPITPLFILKGSGVERDNNGNIAFDAAWRIVGRGRVYSEFFIDDLQSPTSLFDDFWANKWAWMAGMHWIFPAGPAEGGAVAEYARVEPWVYTHYTPGTAQTAHYGHPLGIQAGPNSQTLILKAYLRSGEAWYASTRMDLAWKGTDPGSGLDDSVTRAMEDTPKEFIRGVGFPEIRFVPNGHLALGRRIALEAEAVIGRDWRALLRIQAKY